MLFENDACFPIAILVSSVIVCLMCSLRRVETESRFLGTLYASLTWPDPWRGFAYKTHTWTKASLADLQKWRNALRTQCLRQDPANWNSVTPVKTPSCRFEPFVRANHGVSLPLSTQTTQVSNATLTHSTQLFSRTENLKISVVGGSIF